MFKKSARHLSRMQGSASLGSLEKKADSHVWNKPKMSACLSFFHSYLRSVTFITSLSL